MKRSCTTYEASRQAAASRNLRDVVNLFLGFLSISILRFVIALFEGVRIRGNRPSSPRLLRRFHLPSCSAPTCQDKRWKRQVLRWARTKDGSIRWCSLLADASEGPVREALHAVLIAGE